MNVSSWLKTAKKKVNSLDAELILLNVINEKDRTFLATHDGRELSEDELKKADNALKRRANGEPLAYILGYKEFYGRDFIVANKARTLVPRTETESIIDMVKELSPAPKKILDVGTGSGCIAITLKLELGAEVLASDIIAGALDVAKKNAENLGAEVGFIESDLMEKIDGNFDVVVANLPYVDENWDWLDKKALSFEPKEALYAKDGGLDLIKKLIKQAENRTKYLILECDTSQQKTVIEFAKNYNFELVKKDNFIITLRKLQG